MRIRVQHKNGEHETLELRGSWTVHEGKYLNRLRSNTEPVEHFFTPEGYYDGWGAAVPEGEEQNAGRVLEAMEQRREIEGE